MKLTILCICMLCFLYVPLKESLHMYQQNRYQMERYTTWLKEAITVQRHFILRMLLLLLPFCALALIPDSEHVYSSFLVLLLIYAYLLGKWDSEKEYIQAIKYTHRIKRLLLLTLVLFTLLLTLFYHCFSIRFLCIIGPILFFSPWLMMVVNGTIMYPIEQKIRYYYVHEAQQILRDREKLIKVGITGSYGKTSTKNILHTILSEKYYAFMTPHSYNNLMGLTISIRNLLKPLHEVFIAEMGADHVGEIKELASFIQPSIAIVTAVGPQHLETFGTQEHILKEKMQLVEQLPFHGVAILNYDNELIRSYSIQSPCHIITYGIHQENVDVRALHITYSQKGTSFTIDHKGHTFEVQTCLLGEHNVLNILAAVCAAKALQVSDKAIQDAVARLRYVEHRLEIRNMGMYTLLDDAYNSNPQGAAYALDVLKSMSGTRYLITPGFLDLGPLKKEAHQVYAKKMCSCTDVIILIGPTQTRDIYDTLLKEGYPIDQIHVLPTMKEAFTLLHTMVKKDDTVLIENDLPDAFNH